jgi:UDP:flavonoid glycosyltransferase YjiC (YdhE family)
MYLSGYAATPAFLLSSPALTASDDRNRRIEKLNRISFKKYRVVMATIGSLGDLHPYIALALEMKKRNIEPVIATTENYRERIESLGIQFHRIRPDLPNPGTPEYLEMMDGVVDPNHGAEYLFKRLLAPAIRGMYHDLRAAIKDADLLVTHPIVLAGPLVAQTSGIPWISTVLSPASLWSEFDPFVPPNMPWLHKVLTLLGPSAARLFKKAIETLTDPWLVQLYELREDLGLPPSEHPLFEGQFSPELNLALFANAFCIPKSDWPSNTVVTGFPFFDQTDNVMDPELKRFLDEGPPPIVFTLGSAAIHVAGDFYRESVAAAKMLQRRAVLLVGNDQNRLQEPLPEGIVAFNYAPFGELLPRAKALVHQGGVGTTGQGLRAGIPMLVVPFAHDQPDNAARVTRLGVGRTISRSNYKAARVAKELRELLLNPVYVKRAYQIGHRVRCENGASLAVSHILTQLNERVSNRPALRIVA